MYEAFEVLRDIWINQSEQTFNKELNISKQITSNNWQLRKFIQNVRKKNLNYQTFHTYFDNSGEKLASFLSKQDKHSKNNMILDIISIFDIRLNILGNLEIN